MKRFLILLAAMICISAASAQGKDSNNYLSKAEYQNLKVRADKNNDPEAQYLLGNYMYQGMIKGLSSDDSKKGAARYWALARNNGHAMATGNLAFCYRNGVGVSVDSLRARKLYIESVTIGNQGLVEQLDRSARSGSTFDALILYDCAREGKGMDKNERLATEYLTIAADNGDQKAIRQLADILYKNNDFEGALKRLRAIAKPSSEERFRIALIELPTNSKSAIEALTVLADESYRPAQERLGQIFFKGYNDDIEPDFEKAAEWNRKAVAQGSYVAGMTLASQLINGNGVDVDYDQALYFLENAVPAGYSRQFRDSINGNWAKLPFINYLRGVAYAKSGDYETAKKYYKLAKKDKVAGADVKIAMIDAMKGDATKSFKELAKLAKKGDAKAYAPLAELYLKGQGTNRDLDLALEYALKASNEGDPRGKCIAGDIYMAMNQPEEAVLFYERAEETGMLLPESRANYVKCLQRGLGCKTNPEKAKVIENAVPVDRIIDIYTLTRQEAEAK